MESADATSLPVRLAIALLKDRDGRIALEIPVEGSLDDPQFNLGKVVYRAIDTVLSRIVTSPFTALGALFGGKGEGLSFQEFQPGSTNFQPAAIAKLDVLANALYERPELQLELEGSADPLTDLEALRRSVLKRQSLVQAWNSHLFPVGTAAPATEGQPVRTGLSRDSARCSSKTGGRARPKCESIPSPNRKGRTAKSHGVGPRRLFQRQPRECVAAMKR